MLELLLEIIAEIAFWREDYKFSKKKKARREYEKENNLPKKLMIHPTLKVFVIILFLVVSAIIVFNFIKPNFFGTLNTKEKMSEIKSILDNEKKSIGVYPKELKEIIRNNPLRNKIDYDYWDNEFYYYQTENGMNYTLKSKGRDGVLNTEDDIE